MFRITYLGEFTLQWYKFSRYFLFIPILLQGGDRQISVVPISLRWVYLSIVLRLRVCSSFQLWMHFYLQSSTHHTAVMTKTQGLALALSISPQRESWYWQLLNFWVSAVTLILSCEDHFHLC